jgi:small subunit ribosomal protein S17
MKKTLIGLVASAKSAKTLKVQVQTRVKHRKYGKFLNAVQTCTAHDELSQSKVGDLVEIIESRPLSRTKRWQLVRVISKSED